MTSATTSTTPTPTPTTKTSSYYDDEPSFRYKLDEDIHALPNVEKWPNRPIYLQARKENTKCILQGTTTCESLPIGVPIDFESDLFKGKVLVRVRNVNSNVSENYSSYFHGRKRFRQFIFQGRFKEPLKMSEVHFGDIYGKPLKMSSILHFVGPFLQKVIPGVIMDLTSDSPKIVVLMGGEAKSMNVNYPGSEPDITEHNLSENSSLAGFGSLKERKKILRTPHTASQYKYDPNLVYTMEFYDDVIDMESYTVKIPVFGKISLEPIMNNNPFTFAAVTTDNKFIFNFRLYHELLVSYKTSKTDEKSDTWEDNDNEVIS